jgi:hypothetical protein
MRDLLYSSTLDCGGLAQTRVLLEKAPCKLYGIRVGTCADACVVSSVS